MKERYIEFPSNLCFPNTERFLEDMDVYYMVDRIDYAYDERYFLLRTKNVDDFEFDELLTILEDEFGRGDVREL